MYSMSGPSSFSLLSGSHQSWGAALAVKPGGASASSASPSASASSEAQVSEETYIEGLPPSNNAEWPAGSRACAEISTRRRCYRPRWPNTFRWGARSCRIACAERFSRFSAVPGTNSKIRPFWSRNGSETAEKWLENGRFLAKVTASASHRCGYQSWGVSLPLKLVVVRTTSWREGVRAHRPIMAGRECCRIAACLRRMGALYTRV
jgi:hypothetical protein